MKSVKVGDLVQFGQSDGIDGEVDRRIGIVTSPVFVGGYDQDVVKVLTTHFVTGEEIYATWPLTYFEVLA